MARGVAILSDLPESVGGKVVNRFCGSSMDSVHQLSQAIASRLFVINDQHLHAVISSYGKCSRTVYVVPLSSTSTVARLS